MVLLLDRGSGAGLRSEPGGVIVWRVAAGGRILRVRQGDAVDSGKRAEVIVKGVVFLNNDDDVIDWIVRFHTRLFCWCNLSSGKEATERGSVRRPSRSTTIEWG